MGNQSLATLKATDDPPLSSNADESALIMSILAGTRERLVGAIAHALVGHVTLKDAVRTLRASMLTQALEMSSGSRRAAARVLGISRPAVQRMLRELWDFEDTLVPPLRRDE